MEGTELPQPAPKDLGTFGPAKEKAGNPSAILNKPNKLFTILAYTFKKFPSSTAFREYPEIFNVIDNVFSLDNDPPPLLSCVFCKF